MPENDVKQPEPLGQKNMAELFFQNGSAQMGVMVSIVAMVSQSFARIGVDPLITAIIVSLLLAIYQIAIVQKATRRECVVLVPLAAAIVFSMSLGTNNLVAGLKAGDQSDPVTTTQQKEINLLKQQLVNERLTNDLLRRLAGLPPGGESSQHSNSGSSAQYGTASVFEDLLGFFVRDAYGQEKPLPLKPPAPVEQKKLIEKLRAYELEQRNLQDEAKKLKEQTQQRQQQPSTLWRQW